MSLLLFASDEWNTSVSYSLPGGQCVTYWSVSGAHLWVELEAFLYSRELDKRVVSDLGMAINRRRGNWNAVVWTRHSMVISSGTTLLLMQRSEEQKGKSIAFSINLTPRFLLSPATAFNAEHLEKHGTPSVSHSAGLETLLRLFSNISIFDENAIGIQKRHSSSTNSRKENDVDIDGLMSLRSLTFCVAPMYFVMKRVSGISCQALIVEVLAVTSAS